MEYSNSNSESWNLKDLGAALDNSNQNGRWFIRLPKFQRSLVWSDKQKIQLIDSLYRGFPIGTLLTYQTDEKVDRRIVLEAVDGLQRMSTIDEYLKSPLKFTPVELLFERAFIEKVATALNLGVSEQEIAATMNKFESWLRATKIMKPNAGWNFEKFKKSLAKDDEQEENLEQLSEDFYDALTHAQEIVLQVNTSKIPVITYTGAISNIPTIFERINNQGTQLSKYEIYAATWINAQTTISNPEIRTAIREKYEVLTNSGYEISGYDPSVEIQPDDFNLFEYLFGLGKVMSKKFPLLFSNSGNSDEVNPIAFVLFAVLLQLKVAEMDKLASKMPRNNSAIIDPTAIEAAILRACNKVSTALAPFLSLRLNSSPNTTFIPHSQNQILSLVVEYLLNSSDLETWKEIQSTKADSIAGNIAQHYIYDIIRNSWRGSGDSRLSALAWDEDSAPATYYANSISKQNMSEAIRSWHDELLMGRQKERARVAPTVKAVLLFVYADIVSFYENAAVDFELEHIYPVSYLAGRISSLNDEGWPISALGNLMILPKNLNRIKGKNLLGDFLPNLQAPDSLSPEQEETLQKHLLSPEWRSITAQNQIARQDYLIFCNNRVSSMIEQIASVLHLT